MKKLAEVLSGPEKWCQGSYTINGIHVQECLLGGLVTLLNCEAGDLGPQDSEWQRMMRAIGDEDTEVWDSPIHYNDHPARTFTEIARVVSAYDRRRMLGT